MKYFNNNDENLLNSMFLIQPQKFSKSDDRRFLMNTLGANLMTPMNNTNIADNLLSGKFKNLMCNTWDLEDGVGNIDKKVLLDNLKINLQILNTTIIKNKIDVDNIPYIFIRVKDIDMLNDFSEFADEFKFCSGIMLPKCTAENLDIYINIIKDMNRRNNMNLYILPILEAREIITLPNNVDNIVKIKDILDKNKERILNIIIGGTDLSGLYSIRRSVKLTIYDILVVRECISNIINVFLIDNQYAISATVWEYFNDDFFSVENQGILKELSYDKQNGMYSKLCIHPTQILSIILSYVVTYEEYVDAMQIINNDNTKIGALKSTVTNRMNELLPHLKWAEAIMERAKIFGVFNEYISIEKAFELLN